MYYFASLEENKSKVFLTISFVLWNLRYSWRTKALGYWVTKYNRSCDCPLLTKNEMKKEGCGFFKEIPTSDDTILVTAWYDNGRVLMISNFIEKEPVGTCENFD